VYLLRGIFVFLDCFVLDKLLTVTAFFCPLLSPIDIRESRNLFPNITGIGVLARRI
jgi:hypothetical protein